MKITNSSIVLALVLAPAATMLSACGGGGTVTNQSTTATGSDKPGGGGSKGASGDDSTPCPGDAEVSAAVGSPVRSKPYRFGCHYEASDGFTSVVIMYISPDRADLLPEQMRPTAKSYGAELTAIDVGERGYAWSSPAQSQGFAVAGDRAYMIEIITTGGGGDKRNAVIQILKKVTG